MRRVAALAAALSVLLLTAVPALATGKPTPTCPPGFNLGTQTLEQWLALPRTEAAIADGLTTEQDVTDWFNAFDSNGDGMVCAQLSHGFELTAPNAYFYNAVEDNASVPG
jgi:hypothetical protein